MILNATLIRRRRRALDITQRGLAKEIGVTSMVINALEAGTNHHSLSLGLVERLARALAVHPAQLYLDPGDEGPDVAVDSSDQSHISQLGALLLETGVLTPIEALADALGSTLETIEEALTALETTLAPAGLVLHRRTGAVALRPAASNNSDTLKRLLRTHQARRGLSLTQARLLRRVLDSSVDEAVLSNPDRVALERLRNAGLVDEERRPQITAEVAASLAFAVPPDDTRPEKGGAPTLSTRTY